MTVIRLTLIVDDEGWPFDSCEPGCRQIECTHNADPIIKAIDDLANELPFHFTYDAKK